MSDVRDERGVTLVELLVSMTIGMIAILGIFTIVDISSRSSAKVTARVDANQRARVVMQNLIEDLHSTCVGPEPPPVLVGSDKYTLSFLHETGAAVTPVPDKQVVSWSDTTNKLSQSIYPVTGGDPPDWDFSTTASSTTQLIEGVAPTTAGGPIFRYFADEGGQLSITPLPTPLSAADAARAVKVAVSLRVSPTSNPTADDDAAVNVSDSAVLRFSPFGEDLTKVNGPCA